VEALTHMHTLNQSHSGDKTKQTTPSALSLSLEHTRQKQINSQTTGRKKDASGLMLSQQRSIKNAAQMAKSHTQLGEARPAILELIRANKAKQTQKNSL
jgi:hypothetical protein